MPGLVAGVRRFVDANRQVWPVVVAMAVVGSVLWAGVPSAGRQVTLPAAAMRGVTLEQVRPSADGEVDPRLGAAVDALLARRGIAVRTGDLQLFLRDVAPELQPAQRLLFQNFRKLGMNATFRRAEIWDNYPATQRYGLATGTFRVSMRYQLSGSRLAQAATDLGYTFTVRDGRLYLVDDDDLDPVLRSNRQPWDYGPIDVVKRRNVIVVVDEGQLERAERLADETVLMARKVRKLWKGYLQIVPMVVALRRPDVLTELPSMPPPPETAGTTPTSGGGTESGTPEPARIQPMPSPAVDGRPVGGWLVVRPAAIATIDSAQLTHALVHLLPVRLGEEAPRWLVEGLARYAESLQLVATGRSAQVAARREAVHRQLAGLTRLPADDQFVNTHSDDISWLAVEQLIKQVGLTTVTDYYNQVARRGYNDFARERLMKEYTGRTEQDLVDSLRNLAQ